MLLSLYSVLVISALFLIIEVRSQECGLSPAVPTEEGEVVNAAEGSWPWMVAIARTTGSGREILCNGFLIDDIHLLTAAQCFDYEQTPMDLELWTEQFSALIGSVDLDEAEEYYIERITKHPDYIKRQYYNDIAIVKLSVRVAFPGLNPVCLEKINASQLLTDVKATEVGWSDLGSIYPENLKQLSGFKFVSNSDCRSKYKGILDSGKSFPRGLIATNLCAVTPNKNYGCVGFSGSPLMILNRGRWSAVGLVTASFKCGMTGFPDIYTRLTPYLDWIKRNTRSKGK